MPIFNFRLEDDRNVTSMDLNDLDMARMTAKYVGRHLAAQSVASGRIRASQSIMIEDEAGTLLASLPLDGSVAFR